MCMVYKAVVQIFLKCYFNQEQKKKLSALAVNIFNSIQKLFDKGKQYQ